MMRLNHALSVLLIVIGIVLADFAHSQVGIGTMTPNSSAVLELQSNSGGLLLPRMDRSERNQITDPAAGLMIYCTDCSGGRIQVYNGTHWVELSPNQLPLALSIQQSGTPLVGLILTGSYTYLDAESDPEGATQLRWFRADDASGTNEIAISGATASTYTITTTDIGKYIRYGVIPVAQTGSSPGILTKSTSFAGPVLSCSIVDNYNNCYLDITNGSVHWLDRNLGAGAVAGSPFDINGFGSLFQWGRLPDGHEQINWIAGTPVNGTTSILATSSTPGHSLFIIASASPYDWLQTPNPSLWQGVSGTNNPCPSGYRVPTKVEWETEMGTWSTPDQSGAFASPLQLPAPGNRHYSSGVLNPGGQGMYWSSTVSGTNSYLLQVTDLAASISSFRRAYGLSVRCIKN